VDALVGRQTRVHHDLDLAIVADREATALAALAELGYAVETDWRPLRVEVVPPGRGWVDLQPVVFDKSGHRWQTDLDGGRFHYPKECFVTGTIAGRTVNCLSLTQQLLFHSGCEPRNRLSSRSEA
jgi:lincosamide nucleotidyltransferase A/C/D/E